MPKYCKHHKGNSSVYPEDMCSACITDKEMIAMRDKVQELQALNRRLRRNIVEMEEALEEPQRQFKRLIVKPLQEG